MYLKLFFGAVNFEATREKLQTQVIIAKIFLEENGEKIGYKIKGKKQNLVRSIFMIFFERTLQDLRATS